MTWPTAPDAIDASLEDTALHAEAGPGARPSDNPSGWVDPPSLGPDEPCCTLGDPVLVAERPSTDLSDTMPFVAWGPDRWAIAVTHHSGSARSVVVHQLEAEGTPAVSARMMTSPSETSPAVRALRFASGRWVLAVSNTEITGPEREGHVRFFDPTFDPAGPWWPVGSGTAIDLAHLAHGDRWMIFSAQTDATRAARIDESEGPGRSVDATNPWSRSLRAVGLSSRAVVLPLGTEESPDLLVVDSDASIVGRLGLSIERGDLRGGSLGALRDVAVVVVRRQDRVEVEVADPFTSRWIHGPQVLGEIGTDGSGGADVAGNSVRGVAGVCWTADETRDGTSQVLFRLVDQEGNPRGAAVTVVEAAFRGVSPHCIVGSDERGFLVAWWTGNALWVRRIDIAS